MCLCWYYGVKSLDLNDNVISVLIIAVRVGAVIIFFCFTPMFLMHLSPSQFQEEPEQRKKEGRLTRLIITLIFKFGGPDQFTCIMHQRPCCLLLFSIQAYIVTRITTPFFHSPMLTLLCAYSLCWPSWNEQMLTTTMSRGELSYIQQGVAHNVRQDGRGRMDFR